MTVCTRYAPSPTGSLHIGNVRSGLFAYLFARHNGGRFILRVDDTDQERSTQESLEEIISSLQWLGIEWDAGPPDRRYFQSSRFDRYREAAVGLLREGKAYPCYCTPRSLRPSAVRPSARGANPAMTAPAATNRIARGPAAARPRRRTQLHYSLPLAAPRGRPSSKTWSRGIRSLRTASWTT